MTDTKKKLLYFSVHSVLEHDELRLFTDLGYDCFSLGAYTDPAGHKSLPRPKIEGMAAHPEYEEIARKYPKTNLPPEFLEEFDYIVVMHQPEWVVENWEKMKHKKVIWRSIGQSTRSVENKIRKMRYQGLKIVRYSPLEQNIPDYLGADAIIRFYKDSKEWRGYTGVENRVINFTQTLKGRRIFCHYDHIMQAIEGFPALIYGSGNDDLGSLNGGDLPYDLMKGALRDNRVFFYGGTWPAPYSLTLIEAMMTGIPVISIGRNMAEVISGLATDEVGHFFEIPDIIQDGVNGYFSDDLRVLRTHIHELLENRELAKKIGEAGRMRAIELFGSEAIKNQWSEFFKKI